jgi:GNAT superfamily N-acetyltransferase
MESVNQIEILPFQPENQEAVKTLILAGLGEHWGKIDPTKNPDLDDIALSYKNEVFLVAWKEGKIIGTGALVRRSGTSAEIVRMSVANKFRRQGIGKLILGGLIESAQGLGCSQVILETTETWDDVIAFYLDYGFRITHHQDGDVYFALN